MLDAMIPALHSDMYRGSHGLRAGEGKYDGVIDQLTAISLRDGRRQRPADGRVGGGKLQPKRLPIRAQACLASDELDPVGAVGDVDIPLILIRLTAKAHGSGGTRTAGEREIDHDSEDCHDQQRQDGCTAHDLYLLSRDHGT
jgi:hypothetical protein